MRPIVGVFCAAIALIPPTTAAAQTDIGIRTGDTVTVGTAFGWINAIVLAASGHDFRVRLINGPEVLKSYPRELRRLGPLTAYDRANGVYGIDDRVQVLYQGKWVDSRVISSLGMDYEVALPGNMKGWARTDQIRFVGEPPPKVMATDRPPPAGMTSCAGGMPVGLVFRSGRFTIREAGQDAGTGQCWTGGGRVILRLEGEENEMVIDINDDGTLQTPLGEMKKRAR
jgi:hypothetical protein